MTTISSTTTGTISSAGIGSGLDVSSIISSLMKVEQVPLTRLQTVASGLQTQLSAFGQVKSLVSGLQDAAKGLTSADTYKLTNAVSSDSSSVSAGSKTGAAAGTYAVQVTALASTQSVVSASGQFADATGVVGSGTLTIQLGSWAGTAFTAKSGSAAVSVTIDSSANTLADVRDKINAANAGVTASIVTDATGSRLALTSTSTGLVNGFQVTATDDDGDGTDAAGLSRLAYDPSAGVGNMTRTQTAGDAQATINGIAIASASNLLDSAIDGMTFSLNKVTTSAVNITVSRNTDAVKTKLVAFVAAWNSLNTFLSAATKYDASTKTAALLQGDSTATGMQNQLRSMLGTPSSASSSLSTLSSLGVRFGKDGTLAIDDTAYNAAVANFPEFTKALGNVSTEGDAADGFAQRFAEWTDRVLATGGTLPGKTDMLQKRIDQNGKDQEAMQLRIDATESRLRAQYTALDTAMAKANALSAYVTQQFYTLAKKDQD